MSRRKRLGIVAIVLMVLLAFGALGVRSLRVPEGTTVIQALGTNYHSSTQWSIEPSYAMDALCFFNYLSGDRYYLNLFGEEVRADIARFVQSESAKEQKAISRLYRLLHHRLGIIPSSAFLGLYSISGATDLATFRPWLEHPERFRTERKAELDAFYRVRLNGWRVPDLVFDSVAANLSVYLDFLDHSGFRAYWETHAKADLAQLAQSLSAGITNYDVVPVAERIAGGSLPDNRIHIYLARFARPSGVTLGGAELVMEERTDAPSLARICAHELLHHRVDWSRLRDVVSAVGKDPIAGRRFRERDRHAGYNSLVALAEEGLTRALDQVVAEELGVAKDPRERWFFEDDGLHVSAWTFYRLLHEEGGASTTVRREPLSARLEHWEQAGRLRPGGFAQVWESAYGLDRPGHLGESPHIVLAYGYGDPALDALDGSYRKVMRPGMFVVFVDDWLAAADAKASIAALDEAARREGRALELQPPTGPVLRVSYRLAGNWMQPRHGTSFFYKNAFYYEVLAEDAARLASGAPYRLLAAERGTNSGWNLSPGLTVAFR
jgi:hypothetical protein